MQLGTRWSAGDPPPARLTPEMVAGIRAVDEDLPVGERGLARWTLTWLEGRAVAELDLGIVVTHDHDGRVVVRREEDAPA